MQDKKTQIEDDDYLEVNSYCECTGLIPTPPRDREEAKNYLDIYPYLTKAKEDR